VERILTSYTAHPSAVRQKKMNSENRSDRTPGAFTSASTIALFVVSLFFFYGAWWAHQRSTVKASDLAVIEGTVSSSRIKQPTGGLPLFSTVKLEFSLNDRRALFFVKRVGAGKAFDALADSLKPGVAARLWTASAGSSSGSEKWQEARQVAISGGIVFPLAAWQARYRFMQWLSGALFVLLFAASIGMHLRTLRRDS
jgi:hypothetical protein